MIEINLLLSSTNINIGYFKLDFSILAISFSSLSHFNNLDLILFTEIFLTGMSSVAFNKSISVILSPSSFCQDVSCNPSLITLLTNEISSDSVNRITFFILSIVWSKPCWV